jgi:hypothetical protein
VSGVALHAGRLYVTSFDAPFLGRLAAGGALSPLP